MGAGGKAAASISGARKFITAWVEGNFKIADQLQPIVTGVPSTVPVTVQLSALSCVMLVITYACIYSSTPATKKLISPPVRAALRFAFRALLAAAERMPKVPRSTQPVS